MGIKPTTRDSTAMHYPTGRTMHHHLNASYPPLAPHGTPPSLHAFHTLRLQKLPPSDTTPSHGSRSLVHTEVGLLSPLPHPDVGVEAIPSLMASPASFNSIRPRVSHMRSTAN